MQWEIELYNGFLEIIQQQQLKPEIDDAMMWSLNSSSELSTKSFCCLVESLVASNSIGSPLAGFA